MSSVMQSIVEIHRRALRTLAAGAPKIAEDDSEIEEWGKEFADKLVSLELVIQISVLIVTNVGTIPCFEGGHWIGCDGGHGGTRMGANCDIGTRCGRGSVLDRLGGRRVYAAIGEDRARRTRDLDARGGRGGKPGSGGCEGGRRSGSKSGRSTKRRSSASQTNRENVRTHPTISSEGHHRCATPTRDARPPRVRIRGGKRARSLRRVESARIAMMMSRRATRGNGAR